MNEKDKLKIKLFLEKIEGNKWCYNVTARKKIKENLKECDLL